jgi:two-component system cell cycle response regulator DivK
MGSATILMIEDNTINMKLFSVMLQSAGYSVLWAENAEEGIPMIEREMPNLILMDIGLPGMDGLEATRRLKGNPQTASIPIIAVTAHSLQSDREEAIRAGCTEYIAKPVRMNHFLDTIAGVLAPRLKT